MTRLCAIILLLCAALQAVPPSPGWSKAVAAYQAGRYADSRAILEKLITAEPANVAYLGLLGLCQSELFDYGSAIANLERARRAGIPEKLGMRMAVTFQLASGYLFAGRFEEAAALLQELPETEETRLALGLARARIALLPSAARESLDPGQLKHFSALGAGKK